MTAEMILSGTLANLCSLIVQLFISRENHLPPTKRPNQSDNAYSGGEDRRPDTRSGRGYLARSDQGRHLSSLKSASRLAKGLTAAGVGIASTAIIGLY